MTIRLKILHRSNLSWKDRRLELD